jgi:hypothetical protein
MNYSRLTFSNDGWPNSNAIIEEAGLIIDPNSIKILRSLFLYVSSYFFESMISCNENGPQYFVFRPGYHESMLYNEFLYLSEDGLGC